MKPLNLITPLAFLAMLAHGAPEFDRRPEPQPCATPEPSTLGLVGAALLTAALARKKLAPTSEKR